MFKMKLAVAKQGMNTYIGSGTVIDGNIQCRGCLKIDGMVNGDLQVEGDIIVGDSGVVTGNTSSNSIIIAGTIEGNVTSMGILRLLSTARLNGDIHVGGFIADEGGIFVGKCTICQPPQKVLEAVYSDRMNNNDLPLGNLAIGK